MTDIPYQHEVRPLRCSVFELLSRYSGRLYAVLDAAQDTRILEILRSAPDEHRSLYEGPQGDDMAEAAPYLIHFNADSGTLQTVVEEGWGKSWGIFLLSDRHFSEVRRHLRRFLTVKTEEGQHLYFRFYDPRVLKAFLPTCDIDQLQSLFGPASRLIVEDGITSVRAFALSTGHLTAVTHQKQVS